jgi:hypothetical protein
MLEEVVILSEAQEFPDEKPVPTLKKAGVPPERYRSTRNMWKTFFECLKECRPEIPLMLGLLVKEMSELKDEAAEAMAKGKISPEEYSELKKHFDEAVKRVTEEMEKAFREKCTIRPK